MKKHSAPAINPAYLRRDEAAAYLSVSPRTISEWQRQRVISYTKPRPKCVLFKRSDLDAAMQRFTVKAVGA